MPGPRIDRRLFISDLDGTLLLPDKTMGPRTRSVLRRFIDAGGAFTIATGRSAPSAAERLDGLALSADAIVHNGAMTVDLASGEITHTATLDGALAATLFAQALAAGLSPVAYLLTERGAVLHWSGDGNAPTRKYVDLLSGLHDMVVDDGRGLAAGEVLSMIVIDDPDLMSRYFDRRCAPLSEVTSYPGWSSYDRRLGVGEIVSAAASKALAAAVIARRRRRGPGEVVAFGDNLNDLPLLAWAGEARCPPDAHPDVLAEVAGRIDRVEDEGVAAFMERVLRGQR